MEKQKSAVKAIRKKSGVADQSRREIAALSVLGLIALSILSL